MDDEFTCHPEVNNQSVSACKAEMKELAPALYVKEGLSLEESLESLYAMFGGDLFVTNFD